ncbi:MAG TPA: hypothetical protein VNU00_00615, partial [Candidatus Binataceae bacterium]|nr:hypothetical protein [Candidatus Binataceae bacterium]
MSTLHVGHIRKAVTDRFGSLIDLSDLKPTLPTEERENHFLTRALAAFAIAELASVDDAIAAAGVVDGPGDNGIDAFYFDHEERLCYVIQSKWNKNGKKSIELGEMLKFIQGVHDLIDFKLDHFDKLQKHKNDVDYAPTDISAKFVLVVAYTGEPALADPVRQPLDKLLGELNDINISFSYRVLRQGELHAVVAQKAQGQSIDFSIMLYEWGTVDSPYRAFYGQVALEEIAKWGAYGQSLFAKNLRGFKGSTEVNESIISTMRQ